MPRIPLSLCAQMAAAAAVAAPVTIVKSDTHIVPISACIGLVEDVKYMRTQWFLVRGALVAPAGQPVVPCKSCIRFRKQMRFAIETALVALNAEEIIKIAAGTKVDFKALTAEMDPAYAAACEDVQCPMRTGSFRVAPLIHPVSTHADACAMVTVMEKAFSVVGFTIVVHTAGAPPPAVRF